MNNQYVQREMKKLNTLFARVHALSFDPYLQSHWAKYLCVLVSGFLEKSISRILVDYCLCQSSERVANYIDGRLNKFTNPNMAKIISLANSFDPSWGEEITNQTEGALKDAIDSIYQNRILVAHGRESQSPISFSRISAWYQNAIQVIDLIETTCSN